MKKILSVFLVLTMLIGCICTNVLSASADEIEKYDDMESYTSKDKFNVKVHKSFSNFGEGKAKITVSDKIVHSGQKALHQKNRNKTGGTIKALNLFGRELTKADVGKKIAISFYVYADMNDGVFKSVYSGDEGDDRQKHLYSAEELKESEGTVISVVMAGPDEDNYQNRQGHETPFYGEYFIPWNQWTKITHYYTIGSEFLPTGSTEKKSDPYINAIRIGQTNCDYTINNALASSLYIDDLYVEEARAIINGGFDGNKVEVVTEYATNSGSSYARTMIFEYDTDNRLIGAYIGDKTVTKDALGAEMFTLSEYNRKSDTSKIYATCYGSDPSKPMVSASEILHSDYVTQAYAKKRAKEMIELSKAEYKDALSFDERVDNENEYFESVKDVNVSATHPDSKSSSKTTLNINLDSASVLKFDISKSVKKSVSDAYIYLYASAVYKPGKVEIYAINSSLDENNITYNAASSDIKKVSELTVENKDVVCFFDISSYANEMINKKADNLTFFIKTEDSDVSFISWQSEQKNYKPTLIFEGLGLKEGQKKVSSFDYSNYEIAMKKRDRGTKGTYIPTPTRTIDSLKDYTPVKGELTLNKYGSPITDEKYEATGYFYTKEIDGRWWFIDPEGYRQIHAGVGVVRPEKNNEREKAAFNAKYGTDENWANMVVDELRPYGFNGCGFVGKYKLMLDADKVTPLNQVGYTTILQSYKSYNDGIMYVFDPGFEERADTRAKLLVDKYADNPHVVGWSFDNEPPASDNMLEKYLLFDPFDQENIFNHHTAWEWFKLRHGENARISDMTQKDKTDWVEFIYDRYMNVCVTAIKKYDSNHLIFGPKLDKPNRGSFRGVSKWVDVVAYDYYGNAWTAEHAMIDRFYRWAGKPLINAEWYAKGADAVNDETGLTNFSGVGYQATTQKERGYYYQNFVINMLESKAFIGWHWFRYVDNPGDDKFDEGADTNANKGLYTNFYTPWEELLSQMKMINNNIYALCDYFDR